MLSQFGRLIGVEQGGFAAIQAILVVQMRADQLGEQFERRLGLAIVDVGRLGVDRAQGAEEGAAVLDRHRDVALQAVGPRSVMVAIGLVPRHIAEHDRSSVAANLVAKRGFEH